MILSKKRGGTRLRKTIRSGKQMRTKRGGKRMRTKRGGKLMRTKRGGKRMRTKRSGGGLVNLFKQRRDRKKADKIMREIGQAQKTSASYDNIMKATQQAREAREEQQDKEDSVSSNQPQSGISRHRQGARKGRNERFIPRIEQSTQNKQNIYSVLEPASNSVPTPTFNNRPPPIPSRRMNMSHSPIYNGTA